MICLDNADVIEGGGSVDAVIEYTMHGLVAGVFTQLAAGVMSNVLTAVLYTAGAAISIVSIILVNTHSAAVDVTLRLDPADGGNPRYIIPKTISLGIGYSLHTDGARITVMDASGRILKGYVAHATDHKDGGADDLLSAPGAIGGTTPAAGTFSTLIIAGETKTDNYVITTADFGKTLIMDAADKIFSLPSISASNIGAVLEMVFINTGTLTIDAADADTLDDSGAGDGIYCTQNGEKYSSITLKLVSATEWIILAAKGIWTTTD